MRIASLSPAATEIVFALGMGKQIVCTDQFSNFPEEVKAIAHLNDHQRIDPDALRMHRPDLVLTGTVIQEALAAQLRAEHFPVVHQDPRTLKAVYESILAIGILLEAEDRAEALVRRMKEGFDDVRAKAKKLPKKATVYVEEWHEPPMASGNWVPEVLNVAGATGFPIAAGQLSRAVTLREVYDFDPDLIVISWCGAGALAEKKLLLQRSGWEDMRAVKRGDVTVIDDSLLNRPGPRLVEGAQQLYGRLFELLH